MSIQLKLPENFVQEEEGAETPIPEGATQLILGDLDEFPIEIQQKLLDWASELTQSSDSANKLRKYLTTSYKLKKYLKKLAKTEPAMVEKIQDIIDAFILQYNEFFDNTYGIMSIKA